MKCLVLIVSVMIWATAGYPAVAQVPLPEMGSLQGSGISILSHQVTVSVADIAVVSVSSPSVSMTVNDGTEAVDNSTTYSITVNGLSKKLTGVLDVDYPGSISLDIELAPPSGATAVRRTLGTTSQDLVNGITHTVGTDLAIVYYGNADASEAPNGLGDTRTVTITLTDS